MTFSDKKILFIIFRQSKI